MISFTKDKKNNEFILKFELDDKDDELLLREMMTLLARSNNERELRKMLNAHGAHEVIEQILSYLINNHDIHHEIYKILKNNNFDTSLLENI